MEARNEVSTPPKGQARLMTLDHLDGRTAAARRARELVAALSSDLGGPEHLTVAERQLIQRAAVLGAIIEDQEAHWLAGDKVDVNEHLAAINAQRRVLVTVGLERKARDVTLGLRQNLDQRRESAEFNRFMDHLQADDLDTEPKP